MTSCKFGAWVSLVFACLFAAGVWETSPGVMGFTFREVTDVLEDPRTQWVIFLFFLVYFAAFVIWRMSSHFKAGSAGAALRQAQHDGTCLWIIFALSLCAVNYARHYSSSTEALMFIAGAVLGQGIVAWAGLELRNRRAEVRNLLWLAAIFMLVILLAAASVWSGNSGHDFEYQGRSRWTGPWGNPNLFGLLMAAGVMLAAGLVISSLKSQALGSKWMVGKQALLALCLLAAALMAQGLFHSYSRGAWLGTGCGLVYLGFRFRSRLAGRFLFLKKTNRLSISVILVSALVLSFWHFRQTDWHPVRRAFSAVNAADFSWRNRVAAWEGALQITAEHPWSGAGWNQPEPLYEHYYLPARLNEGLAIEMNDYLLFVATLGLPALFCFGMYLWLSLTWQEKSAPQPEAASQPEPEEQQRATVFGDWTFNALQATCRAGTIVLLTGFWFDGGLFKLPTAVTFWILLEMGGLGGHQISTLAKDRVPRMILHVCRRKAGVPGRVMTLHRPLPTTRSANRHKITAPAARRGTAPRRRPVVSRSAPELACATQSDIQGLS